MTLKDRLINLARAELHDAARRFREGARGFFDPDELDLEDHYPHATAPEVPRREESPEIRRYYANLELPIGASAAEVKAAYRRLMRRYHPDRHHGDPQRQATANELTRRLREAYDLLNQHLDARGR